nr:transposase [Brevibacillus massiliensis]
MKLNNNNHSVFLLYYHLVLVIKYRRKVIHVHISDRLKEIFEYIQPGYNISLRNFEIMKVRANAKPGSASAFPSCDHFPPLWSCMQLKLIRRKPYTPTL